MDKEKNRDTRPASRGPWVESRSVTGRTEIRTFDLDLGGYSIEGPWRLWRNRHGDDRCALVEVDPADVPPVHRIEASLQARRLADLMAAEGWGSERSAGPAWISVLWTLALRSGSWEVALRHVRAGLASTGGGRWKGWHSLVGVDPGYCLWRSFLQATRRGWGVPRGRRFDDGLAWNPATPELREKRDRWLAGEGQMP